MIKRYWEGLPVFIHKNTALACQRSVKEYFDIELIITNEEGGYSLAYIPDPDKDVPKLDEMLRILIEGFIVAWGAGNQYGYIKGRTDRDDIDFGDEKKKKTKKVDKIMN